MRCWSADKAKNGVWRFVWAAIQAQATKLLRAISSAATREDALRAADRSEGFALSIETLRALNPSEVEGLYLVFDRAFQTRQAEQGR